jgi:hypothetical protein
MKILIPEKESYIIDETPLPFDEIMETTWVRPEAEPPRRFGIVDLWKIHSSRKFGRK